MVDFDWCKQLLPQWAGGIRVDHNHLRLELLKANPKLKSYTCARCGVDVLSVNERP